ncbi:beta-lactamase family protein [Aliifodinibius sp. S!AR15-10]|uniref:serine hydrolase domain-containing protein n=1 Tax=Aliifodinibius sp. S!AR15-10 TaxID=2950437 RepID=UPI002862C0C1|nr:serine hydrolase domain-containing protein [Aliifodinibius sp. S!AR15-10]MDR8394621.1 beta-lactamase family protein [Aliifodinibius sp. S!AR15-10]
MIKQKLIFSLLITLPLFSANAQNHESPYSAITPVVEGLMDSLSIPGVQIVITKGTEVLYIRGFGVENIETGKPVDSYQSRFIIGSVSKTFTGVTIQEAVNRGILDKNTDISHYLDFEFDRPFEDSITLNHLMSHSAGLDDKEFGCCTADYTNTASLKSHLQKLNINQIRPAGELISYSDFLGAALAAYILEKNGKQSLLDYYQEFIFDPLDMNNTGVYLDSNLPNQPMSYVNTSTGLFPISKHWGSISYMAGKLYSTADDMGKYMRGLLSPDSLQIEKGWNENLLTQVGKPVFTYNDNEKFSFGFGITTTQTSNGLIHSHNGDVEHFRTEMHLFREENVGLFINTNSSSGNILIRELVSFFLNNYLKQYADPPNERVNTKLPDAFEGSYTRPTYPRHDIGKIKILTWLPQVEVFQNETGNLVLASGSNIEEFIPVGDNTFVDTTRSIHRTLSFGESGGREIIQTTTPFPIPVIATLQKLHWYETLKFQFPFRALSLLIFLIVPLIWVVSYLRKKDWTKINKLKIIFASCMWSGLLSVFSVMYLFSAHQDFISYYVNEVPWEVTAYGLFNLLFGILALVGLVMFIFRFGQLTKMQKFYYSFLVLLLLGYGINNLIFNSYDIVFRN